MEECGDASEGTRRLSAGGHQCQKVWSFPGIAGVRSGYDGSACDQNQEHPHPLSF